MGGVNKRGKRGVDNWGKGVLKEVVTGDKRKLTLHQPSDIGFRSTYRGGRWGGK